MKALTSYWVLPFQFSNEARAEIDRLLKAKAAGFVEAIAEEVTHYIEGARVEVPRQTLRRWRAQIKRLGKVSRIVTRFIDDLDPGCLEMLDQGLVLESHRRNRRKELSEAVRELTQACVRMAASKAFNPPRGAPVDTDKRTLVAACAVAYQHVTGKPPSASPNGTFAQVIIVVMRAAGAVPRNRATISKEFLRSVLSAKGER